jgi:hypothetical protein
MPIERFLHIDLVDLVVRRSATKLLIAPADTANLAESAEIVPCRGAPLASTKVTELARADPVDNRDSQAGLGSHLAAEHADDRRVI